MKSEIIPTLNKTNIKRILPVKNDKLENAVKQWIELCNHSNLPLTDALIQEKARKLATTLGISNFKASNGWLTKFKNRNNYKSYFLSGEIGALKSNDVEQERLSLREKLEKYKRNDIYNLDETGLFYRYPPKRTISNKPVKGTKISKERVTVLLCVNADGSDKRKALVIGKYLNPRCFKHFNVSAFVDYRANGNAWITSVEFLRFIHKLDAEMNAQNRHIALIIDNAPGHKVTAMLKNITIIFLPPNMTGLLQPLDAGIIRSFKAHYRIQLMNHILDRYDNKISTDILFKKISLKDAACFIYAAWKSVARSTIINCWGHTKIIREDNAMDKLCVNNDSIKNDITELDLLIKTLTPNTGYHSKEYINIEGEDEVHGICNDENLLNFVITENDILCETSEEDPNHEIAEKISFEQAKTSLEILKKFIFQHEDCKDHDIKILEDLTTKLREYKKTMKQKKSMIGLLKVLCNNII